MVEKYLYWILDVIRHLYFVLIFHQVSRCYFYVPNVDPVHQFDMRLFRIPHHHILHPIGPLVVDGCADGFLQGDIHVFY